MKILIVGAGVLLAATAAPALANGGGAHGGGGGSSFHGEQSGASQGMGHLKRLFGLLRQGYSDPPGFWSPGKHHGWFRGRHWGWFKPHNPHWPHEPPASP